MVVERGMTSENRRSADRGCASANATPNAAPPQCPTDWPTDRLREGPTDRSPRERLWGVGRCARLQVHVRRGALCSIPVASDRSASPYVAGCASVTSHQPRLLVRGRHRGPSPSGSTALMPGLRLVPRSDTRLPETLSRPPRLRFRPRGCCSALFLASPDLSIERASAKRCPRGRRGSEAPRLAACCGEPRPVVRRSPGPVSVPPNQRREARPPSRATSPRCPTTAS